jgi:hypothetical protein
MCTTSLFNKFQQVAFFNGLFYMAYFLKSYIEIMPGYKVLTIRCFFELFGCMRYTDGTGTWKILKLVHMICTCSGDISPVLSIKGISCRIEQIASKGYCKSEHHGMPCAKQMNGSRRVQSFLAAMMTSNRSA